MITFLVFFICGYNYQIIPYGFGFIDFSLYVNASGPVQ